ncbi:hypothetical protein [Sulfurimonas sp. HSL3-7]|uniref:hypothetical protein n=1 Tax=Sulfonitrofixus jiaomeiensis TaxID=3131938 RepID=UPI0031F7AED9
MEDQGSLHKAVKGEYFFTVGEILSEAWGKVYGAKLKIVGAMLIYLILASLTAGIINLFLDSQPYYDAQETFKGVFIDMLVGWLAAPITIPLSLGLLLLGYSRANGEELNIGSIFNYYVLVWPLVFASILITVITYIGLALLILPGIYLSIAYSFTLPLMVDKGLGIWGAMEVSRQAVTKHWFTVFGVNITLVLLTVLSAIPFGIGLIWTIPLVMIAQGVMYRKIFGWKIHDPINEAQ